MSFFRAYLPNLPLCRKYCVGTSDCLVNRGGIEYSSEPASPNGLNLAEANEAATDNKMRRAERRSFMAVEENPDRERTLRENWLLSEVC